MNVTLFALAVLLLAPLPGAAQDSAAGGVPRIRIVVPFTPGGSMDGLARTLGSALAKSADASVIVENKPGAGGNIAAAFVAKSTSGPYLNLLVTSINHYVNPALQHDAGYDPYKDFVPVAHLGTMPYVIVVPGDSRIDSLKDLVAAGKSEAGKLSWGFGGNGTLGHFVGIALEEAAGFKGNPIAYRGGSDLLAALGGKHIDMVVMTLQSAAPLIRQGRLMALAVTGTERNKVLPQVPTIVEQASAYPQLSGYAFLLAPAGTPEPQLARLHAEVSKVVRTVAFEQRLEGDGAVVQVFATPAETRRFFEQDGRRWEVLARKSGIKLE